MTLDLKIMFMLCGAALPSMRTQRFGAIINISSKAAFSMRPRRAFRQRLPLRKAAGGEDRIARQPARATGPCGGDIGRVQERLNLPQDAAAFDGWRWRKQPRCGIAASHGGSKQASAAMHDAAFGHGLHRAMACDFIIAANGAREDVDGCPGPRPRPGGRGMHFLPCRSGAVAHATESIHAGRAVESAEALSIGLVDRTVILDDLIGTASVRAIALTHGAPAAVALTREILDKTFDKTFDGSDEAVFAPGHQAQAVCLTPPEHPAAIVHRGVSRQERPQGLKAAPRCRTGVPGRVPPVRRVEVARPTDADAPPGFQGSSGARDRASCVRIGPISSKTMVLAMVMAMI